MQFLALLTHYWPALSPLVLPYLVQFAASRSWPSAWKLAFAIAVSALFGLLGALIASGMPSAAVLTVWIGAGILGTQVTVRAFKAIGLTSSWLDALLAFGSDVVSPLAAKQAGR